MVTSSNPLGLQPLPLYFPCGKHMGRKGHHPRGYHREAKTRAKHARRARNCIASAYPKKGNLLRHKSIRLACKIYVLMYLCLKTNILIPIKFCHIFADTIQLCPYSRLMKMRLQNCVRTCSNKWSKKPVA